MQVPIVGQAGVAVNSAAAPNKSQAPTLNYNAFLQLLMAQMRNQDPTSPADSTQWVSQLATFSSVEQAIQTNAKLDQLVQNSNLSDAESLIGRTVTSADAAVSGVVVSVVMSSSGAVATLDNNAKIAITSGKTISKCRKQMGSNLCARLSGR